MWKWPVVKYKHIKIKPRICVLFILCLTWTVNANSLKQNIIVIKEICSWLPPFCKQNLLLFIQPRQHPQQPRLRTASCWLRGGAAHACGGRVLLAVEQVDPGVPPECQNEAAHDAAGEQNSRPDQPQEQRRRTTCYVLPTGPCTVSIIHRFFHAGRRQVAATVSSCGFKHPGQRARIRDEVDREEQHEHQLDQPHGAVVALHEHEVRLGQ